VKHKFTLLTLVAFLLFSVLPGINAATVQDDMGSGGDARNSRWPYGTTMILDVGVLEGIGYLDEED